MARFETFGDTMSLLKIPAVPSNFIWDRNDEREHLAEDILLVGALISQIAASS